jgi:hypothetical protein
VSHAGQLRARDEAVRMVASNPQLQSGIALLFSLARPCPRIFQWIQNSVLDPELFAKRPPRVLSRNVILLRLPKVAVQS